MIAVLTIVAVFAMIVLVMDVGTLFLSRVALQNAADAAALASAQSCARREGFGQANVQAAKYADSNLAGSLIVTGFPKYSPDCDAPAGTVSVQVVATRDLIFAPVLGFPSGAEVGASATAEWGGAGAGAHIAPLMVSASRLSTCQIPPPPAVPYQGQTCTFWWDNSPKSSTDPVLSNAEWGTLDLLNWNVAGNAQCNNSTPPQFESWMFTGFPDPLPINIPPPTYVCRGQGNFGAALDKDLNQAMTQQLKLYFPVNDPPTQVDKDGNLCPPGSVNGCSPDKYDIIGFVQMVITGLYKGNTPQALTNCIARIPGAQPDANARCMTTTWVGWTQQGLDPQGGGNFGVVPIRLIA